MYPTSNALEDEWKRRDEAVEAVVLCYSKGGPLRRRRNWRRMMASKAKRITVLLRKMSFCVQLLSLITRDQIKGLILNWDKNGFKNLLPCPSCSSYDTPISQACPVPLQSLHYPKVILSLQWILLGERTCRKCKRRSGCTWFIGKICARRPRSTWQHVRVISFFLLLSLYGKVLNWRWILPFRVPG